MTDVGMMIEDTPTVDVVSKIDVEILEYDKKLIFDEGKSWHRTADLYAKRMVGLEVELKAMRGAANSYKMHYENLAREIFEEIEQEINAALQSNYKVLPQIEQSESLWNRVTGKIDALRGIDSFIAQLKNKYTGGDDHMEKEKT